MNRSRILEGIDHLINIAKDEIRDSELESSHYPSNTVPTHEVMEDLDVLRNRLRHIVASELETAEPVEGE